MLYWPHVIQKASQDKPNLRLKKCWEVESWKSTFWGGNKGRSFWSHRRFQPPRLSPLALTSRLFRSTWGVFPAAQWVAQGPTERTIWTVRENCSGSSTTSGQSYWNPVSGSQAGTGRQRSYPGPLGKTDASPQAPAKILFPGSLEVHRATGLGRFRLGFSSKDVRSK